MREAQSQSNPMSSKTMIGMLLVLVIMMIVMMFRAYIGQALDVVFQFIAFDGQYPVLTLVIAGLLMITVSTIVRSLMSNPIKMAKNQHIQSEFNKEFRQARIENNLFKMKKLQEMQPEIMNMSMEQSTQQMKTMPVTMIFLMPVYAWVWYFLIAGTDSSTGVVGIYFTEDNPPLVDIPWAQDFNLNTYIWFFPSWIVIYTLISMPIGQIENRLIRYILLKKELRKLDLEVKKAEIQ